MKKRTFQRALKTLNNYVIFFLIVGFAVGCCMMLFVTILAKSMGLTYSAENISVAAKLTFGNVLLITLIFGTIDYVRRKVMVDRPVRRITEATKRIMAGDLSVQIRPVRGANAEGFNQIIGAINDMTRELSGLETLRSDFIANVSHELKTPLAVMGNYATLLKQPNLTEEDRLHYADAIGQASQRLAQLVTNILKLNKLENQQIFSKPREFDLTEQLRTCLLQFEESWETRTLHLQLQEDVSIQSDPELLELVWNNLISNAVKFTPEGGTVTVTLTGDQQQVQVSVKDTGCGMSAETGRHIFEKFYQADTSRTTRGNGLGLALVKRVVDILSGEICVESELEKGSTFTVTLKKES